MKVQLELPRQRSLRTVIDRMKGIDKFLYVDADMGGQLVFRSALFFFVAVLVFGFWLMVCFFGGDFGFRVLSFFFFLSQVFYFFS